MLPFTERDFFDLFERYNEAIWPAQLAAYALGAASLGAAYLPQRRASSFCLIAVAVLWGWTGAAYHWGFFSEINPAARAFAALFIVQALILALTAARGTLQFSAGEGVSGVVAWCMIVYAAILYPLLNAALGHDFPRAPAFGITPCPLVIFTFGVLLLSERRAHWVLFAAPTIWAVIGGSAAVLLDVLPDLALPVSALLALIANARKPLQPQPPYHMNPMSRS